MIRVNLMARTRMVVRINSRLVDELQESSVPSPVLNQCAALPARRIGLSPQELTDYDRQRRPRNEVVVSRAGKDSQLRHWDRLLRRWAARFGGQRWKISEHDCFRAQG